MCANKMEGSAFMVPQLVWFLRGGKEENKYF